MLGIGSCLQKVFGLKKTTDPLSGIKDQPGKSATYVVIDLETTGLDVGKDAILSFGGIKVEGGRAKVEESLEHLFKESEAVLNESVKIHGILNSSVENGHETKEVLIEIHSFIGNSIIVGHHIDFDYSMLKKAFREHLQIELNNPKLDTALLSIRLEKGTLSETISKGEFSLDALCKRYQIEASDRHTAPGDAFLTAQLFIQLLNLADEKGINTVGKLMEKRRGGLM